MYLSIRRSHHALLALSFFIAMLLTVFSTLLYVILTLLLAQTPIYYPGTSLNEERGMIRSRHSSILTEIHPNSL